MIARNFGRVAVLTLGLALGACYTTSPVTMTDKFSSSVGAPPGPGAASPPVPSVAMRCRVELADVRDARTSTDTMGNLGRRMVHAVDTTAWVRSGFEAMNPAAIQYVDAKGAPDLVVKVALLKAYIMGETTAKLANVVLALRYGSETSDVIYRGAVTGTDWAQTDTETQDALNDALGAALTDIQRDFVKRCTATARRS